MVGSPRAQMPLQLGGAFTTPGNVSGFVETAFVLSGDIPGQTGIDPLYRSQWGAPRYQDMEAL